MTWFTARRMRNTAIAIVSFDIILLALWISGAGYITHNLTIECFHDQSISHFLIIVHFVLGLHLAAMVGEIGKELRLFKSRTGKELLRLPYHFYEPFAWVLTSLVSLSGDVILLSWAVIDYTHAASDECDTSRILHISFDTIALISSVVSIIWFLLYTFCTIREADRTIRV